MISLLLFLSAAPAIRFDQIGGDAWSFHRELEGSAPSACAELGLHRSAAGGTIVIEPERRPNARSAA